MLQAKVKKDCRWNTVFACSGIEFVRYEFRNVPGVEAFEEEAKANEFLEVREAPEEPELEVVDMSSGIDATDGAVEFAEAEGVDLSMVEGSGSNGRITKADVEKFLAVIEPEDEDVEIIG